MGAPSGLPLAREVAKRCFTTAHAIDPRINSSLQYDLEGIADHFAASRTLESVFIRQVVPWRDLVAAPNPGHEAVADLLLTGAADHAISTNYDQLIEISVWGLGADFVASLDGVEAAQHSVNHRPLLKIHGCCNRDRDRTVWTRQQLETEPIRARISSTQAWLAANLREKDLVVVGFWSDWGYLNVLLETCLASMYPGAVIVVDPSTSPALEAKAPKLWEVLHAHDVVFHHEQASGADFLSELRLAFSQSYLERVLLTGTAAFEARFGLACPPEWLETSGMSVEELYAWRRDVEGQRIGRAVRARAPRADCQHVAFFHLAFRQLGAVREGAMYRLHGELVRVVNGAGRWLPEMQQEFAREVPVGPEADVTVCVAADDFGVPLHILRSGTPSTVMRPAARGTWIDTNTARTRYGL
jgi:hypothetical protein